MKQSIVQFISRSDSGQSLIELLLAMGLSALFLPALLTGYVASREGRPQQDQRLEAVNLLTEGQEAVRSVREKGWQNIAMNGTFYPQKQAGTWNLVMVTPTAGPLRRWVEISDVLRDKTGKIVESGGSVDLSSKKATVKVSWETPYHSQIFSEMILTRYLKNATFVSSSVADFSAGTLNQTTITDTSGGEIVLGAGGYGDWCKPNLTKTMVDLPKQGKARTISAVEGHISAGTGENASGVSYASVSVTDENPPQASVVGTFDGYKTNDVWTDGHYAYLATDNNAKEVVIIDVSSLPYREVGYFNTPSPDDATSVFVFGNRGYVTAGWWLYIFDLSQKTGSREQIGNPFFLFGTGTSVVVKENYAYISLSNSLIEMQIIDVSNPFYLWTIGWGDVNGSDGKRVFINETGTRAYLATGASISQREFFIFNTSEKTSLRPVLGSYDTNGMDPKSLAVVPGNKAIVVGSGGEEYQVLDITNEANPSRCGGAQIDVGVNGIAAVTEADGDSYAYIITAEANSELKIIEGGPGGQFAKEGTYESPTFSYPSFSSPTRIALNRFDAHIAKPSQTDIKIQLAGTEAVGGACSGVVFNFVGPDGTGGSFWITSDGSTIAGQIPLSTTGVFKNPGYCFRYKAFLSTNDKMATPVLFDLTMNYSL